jgi:DegV family protein with EDD domain
VIVIDSLNASVGQGLIAMYAAECATAGQDGEAVTRAVRAIIPRTLAFGLVGRLDFAVRGGRLPRIVKTIADLLRVTPVLFTRKDGSVRTGAVLFGRRRALTKFARLVRRRLDPGCGYRIAVGHASAEEAGRRLLEQISEGMSNVRQQYLMPLGTALGVHGGPGMLVVAIQEYEPPVAVAGAGPA